MIDYIAHHLSPDPLLRALPRLRPSYVPPPSGSGDEPMINRLAVGGAAALSVARVRIASSAWLRRRLFSYVTSFFRF